VSRRTQTQVLGLLLIVILGVSGGIAKVPYVALSPGPAIDTLGESGGTAVLQITGATVYETDGSLDLTTVSVQQSLTLYDALAGWLSRDKAVIPREILYPPDQTPEQQAAENAQQMEQSQDDAATAALRELGYPETVRVAVDNIINGGPADGMLEPGDFITAVDGVAVRTAAEVGPLVRKHSPGEQVRIDYTRSGTPGTARITTRAAGDDPKRAIIGITPVEVSEFPVQVTIGLKDIGGPSAGLMFALGIIDKLGPESLTGGRSIAGTGTIDPEGKVGPIGGIAEKLVGAKRKGASVFLVPADNCPEARSTAPEGLQLIRVDTLRGALAGLSTLTQGGTPTGC
jgi:PDZ domain-containing protein